MAWNYHRGLWYHSLIQHKSHINDHRFRLVKLLLFEDIEGTPMPRSHRFKRHSYSYSHHIDNQQHPQEIRGPQNSSLAKKKCDRGSMETFPNAYLLKIEQIKSHNRQLMENLRKWIEPTCKNCEKVYHMFEHCLSAMDIVLQSSESLRLTTSHIQYIQMKENVCKRNIFIEIVFSFLKELTEEFTEQLNHSKFYFDNKISSLEADLKNSRHQIRYLQDSILEESHSRKELMEKINSLNVKLEDQTFLNNYYVKEIMILIDEGVVKSKERDEPKNTKLLELSHLRNRIQSRN